jgi:hypothetical protein
VLFSTDWIFAKIQGYCKRNRINQKKKKIFFDIISFKIEKKPIILSARVLYFRDVGGPQKRRD